MAKTPAAEQFCPFPVGWFDAPEQTGPAFDPGFDVDCPGCGLPLLLHGAEAICTPSICVQGDGRSYFFRVHKECYRRDESSFDHAIVEAVARWGL